MRKKVYLFLLLVLTIVIALRSAMKRHNISERFIDNMFVAALIPSNTSSQDVNQIRSQGDDISSSTNAQAYETWRKCNIFTCKNKDAQKDYDAWLEVQKQKLAQYKLMQASIKQRLSTSSSKKTTTQPTCPPRISKDDWDEPILTQDEEEVLNKLDDVEGQIAEAEAKLQELNQTLMGQQAEFESNASSLQQMLNDLEGVNRSQKDMKFYETAIDTQVKPWQSLIQDTKDKVDGYDQAFKDLSKQIGDLTERVDRLPTSFQPPPPPPPPPAPAPAPPAPKKKKKKKKFGLF